MISNTNAIAANVNITNQIHMNS